MGDRMSLINVYVCVFLAILCVWAEGAPVKITILESAKAKGAVCLDGTPPAYHLDPVPDSQNWLVHMEGGGWTESTEESIERTKRDTGSSAKMQKEFGFSGVLGGKKASNPDFYNFNRVKVRYCDGASFTGDAVDQKSKLFYKGAAIFDAIVEDLMSKGMRNAKQVLLSGCSAGGLAVILRCDAFRDKFPANVKVKCLSDAGYFINANDVSGSNAIQEFYSKVVSLHNSVPSLPKSCTSTMKPELCFFPENVVKTLKTPLFIVNAAYDFWQLKNILAPSVADHGGKWRQCKFDLTKCSDAQMKIIQGYRTKFLSTLPRNSGKFIVSCYAHCLMGSLATWAGKGAPKVENTTISEAVGDWYFDRGTKMLIDGPYPSNRSCPKPSDSTSN